MPVARKRFMDIYYAFCKAFEFDLITVMDCLVHMAYRETPLIVRFFRPQGTLQL